MVSISVSPRLTAAALALALLAGCAAQPQTDTPRAPAPAAAEVPPERAVETEALDAGSDATDAAPDVETAATDVTADAPKPEKECGWMPDSARPARDHLTRLHKAGCAVSESDDPASVVEVNVIEIDFSDPKAGTVVRFVLLDAQKERVVPSGRVGYQVILKRRQKGRARLDKLEVRDGVFTLKLRRDAAPKPCKLHVTVHFNNGTKVFEDWVDDWLYLC